MFKFIQKAYNTAVETFSDGKELIYSKPWTAFNLMVLAGSSSLTLLGVISAESIVSSSIFAAVLTGYGKGIEFYQNFDWHKGLNRRKGIFTRAKDAIKNKLKSANTNIRESRSERSRRIKHKRTIERIISNHDNNIIKDNNDSKRKQSSIGKALKKFLKTKNPKSSKGNKDTNLKNSPKKRSQSKGKSFKSGKSQLHKLISKPSPTSFLNGIFGKNKNSSLLLNALNSKGLKKHTSELESKTKDEIEKATLLENSNHIEGCELAKSASINPIQM